MSAFKLKEMYTNTKRDVNKTTMEIFLTILNSLTQKINQINQMNLFQYIHA